MLVFWLSVVAWSSGCTHQSPPTAPAALLQSPSGANEVDSEGIPVGLALVLNDRVKFAASNFKNRWSEPLGVDARFEIGSISKVFAGIILAETAARDEVELTDAVAAYLPGWRLPTDVVSTVRLWHLATHTSGYSFFPANWTPVDRARRETTYTTAMLRRHLAESSPMFVPGTAYRYSNVGTSVLAIALAEATNADYRTLLKDRIFTPLRMTGSDFGNDGRDERLFVAGFDEDGAAVPRRVDLSPMAPCCTVVSTLRDMASFIQANLQCEQAALCGALERARWPHFFRENGAGMGLGWDVDVHSGRVERTGQVEGYRSKIVIDVARRFGVFLVVGSARADVHEMMKLQLEALELD